MMWLLRECYKLPKVDNKRNKFSYLTKSNGRTKCIIPAITRSVSATPTEMHLGQKEEVVGHPPQIWYKPSASPLNCHTLTFINQVVRMIRTDAFVLMVREKGKICVGISITVLKTYVFTIWSKWKFSKYICICIYMYIQWVVKKKWPSMKCAAPKTLHQK